MACEYDKNCHIGNSDILSILNQYIENQYCKKNRLKLFKNWNTDCLNRFTNHKMLN